MTSEDYISLRSSVGWNNFTEEQVRKGIGSSIMDKLVEYATRETPIGGRSSVQLIAEKGKEAFYIKKGFKLIPHEFCGSGMRKIIRK